MVKKRTGYDPLIRFHAELLHDFHQTWRMIGQSGTDKEELERVAYYVLEHAGMLYRYTADEDLRGEMLAKPEEERKNLTIHACHFANAIDTRDYLVQLSGTDEFDDEEMHRLGEALRLRDRLDVVSMWAHDLTFDICRKGFDLGLARALAHVVTQTDMLDDAFSAIPEYVLPALEVFAGIRELVVVPVPEYAWWLGDAHRWLAETNHAIAAQINVMAASAADDILTAQKRTQQPHNVYDFVKALARRLQPVASGRSTEAAAAFADFFNLPPRQVLSRPLGMAAASSSATFPLQVQGAPDLEVIVQWRNDGKLRLSLRQKDGKAPSWMAEVRFQLREGSTLLAQWPVSRGKSVLIDSFPKKGKRRALVVMRGEERIGEVMVPEEKEN